VSIAGKWRITEMDVWDQDAFDLLGPRSSASMANALAASGSSRLRGGMDCRHGERDGRPCVEFTWDGNDECDPASGRGWVRLEKDGTLSGHIFFHQGDASGFKAIRAASDSKTTGTPSRGGRKATRGMR